MYYHTVYKPHTTHNILIHSNGRDKELEISAFQFFTVVNWPFLRSSLLPQRFVGEQYYFTASRNLCYAEKLKKTVSKCLRSNGRQTEHDENSVYNVNQSINQSRTLFTHGTSWGLKITYQKAS